MTYDFPLTTIFGSIYYVLNTTYYPHDFTSLLTTLFPVLGSVTWTMYIPVGRVSILMMALSVVSVWESMDLPVMS